MKLSKSTIAATFAAVLIGGLSIGPASAAVRNNEQSDKSFSQQKVSGWAKSPRETDRMKEGEERIMAQLLMWGW